MFYWLGRQERPFRQHELQFFAENFRVSAILASWRQLRGPAKGPLGVFEDFVFSINRLDGRSCLSCTASRLRADGLPHWWFVRFDRLKPVATLSLALYLPLFFVRGASCSR